MGAADGEMRVDSNFLICWDLEYRHMGIFKKTPILVAVIGVGGSIIVAIISGFFSFLSKEKTGINVTAQNLSNIIQTVNQNGDNYINAPRKLTNNQILSVDKFLREKPPGRVCFKIKIFDPEAKEYAQQLMEIFKNGGWDTSCQVDLNLLDDFQGKINLFKITSKNELELVKIPLFDELKIPYQSEPPRVGSYNGLEKNDALYIEVGGKL